jgi:hypothetical protein
VIEGALAIMWSNPSFGVSPSMSRYVRAAIAVLVGALIVQIGKSVDATSGGLITLLGGVVMLYALVEVFRKRF